MLKYIGEQCVMRGLEFRMGLWMHGYQWINSPDANYTIEGLDKTTHGPYCDSLAPRVFGNASPLDPELFLTMNEYAEELLEGKFRGKYSPIEVAQWIEDFCGGRTQGADAGRIDFKGRDGAAYR
ncbi:MAG TPA: hypothetical protein VGT08_10450 [Terracidiphilus sp.]|nr:hypothetical protein [Terracidiphilus sp.]